MFRKINGKFYLVKSDNTTDTTVELTAEQVANMQEAPAETPAPKADEGEGNEDAVAELKTFVLNTVKTNVADAMKGINSIKGINAEVKSAIAEAFKGNTETKSVFSTEDGKKSLTAQEVVDGVANIKKSWGMNKSYSVNLADGTKTLSELESLTGEVIVSERKPDITRPAVRAVFLESLVDVSNTASNRVTYVEATDATGQPLTTAELEEMPNEDFELNTFGADVKKISVTHTVSNEILEDAPQLVSKIRQWLAEDMNIVAENKMLFGNGGPNEFTGITAIAPTFVAGNFAGKIAEANNFDVLRVAVQQVNSATKARYTPNAILMNPEDVTMMELTKNANGSYVLPPFTSATGMTIKGISIVENPAIPAGTFLVGDFTKAHLANRRGLTLQVATENKDDFVKDLVTVRLTRRFAFYVQNNDSGAFVQGNFATAVTAINKA